MKKILALLCVFMIAYTVSSQMQFNTLEIKYYTLTKMLREQDEIIKEKDKIIVNKLMRNITEIGFFPELVNLVKTAKSRIEILELQVSELQYQVNEFNKKNKKASVTFTKTPEIEEEEKYNNVPITSQSELDAASSGEPINLEK